MGLVARGSARVCETQYIRTKITCHHNPPQWRHGRTLASGPQAQRQTRLIASGSAVLPANGGSVQAGAG
jgi:hypothetical protein